MSGKATLEPGGQVVFSTRPVGLQTELFAQCHDEGDSVLGWQAALCCQPLNKKNLKAGQPWQTDISSAAGALVTVFNEGFNDIDVWTDY